MAATRAQKALEALINDLDAEIASLNEERAAALHALELMSIPNSDSAMTSERMDVDYSDTGSSSFNGMSLIESVKVILETQQPKIMSTRQIAEALLAAGFKTNAENFLAVVSTMLHRYKDDKHGVPSVGRGVWSLER